MSTQRKETKQRPSTSSSSSHDPGLVESSSSYSLQSDARRETHRRQSGCPKDSSTAHGHQLRPHQSTGMATDTDYLFVHGKDLREYSLTNNYSHSESNHKHPGTSSVDFQSARTSHPTTPEHQDTNRLSFSAFHYSMGPTPDEQPSRGVNVDRPLESSRIRTHENRSIQPPEDDDTQTRQLQKTDRVCSAYLRGQLANVAKAAVWWSTFGVVAEALTKLPLAVGTTRLVFNLALVLVSPLAGTVGESAKMWTLLRSTTLGRLVIGCFLIPVSWCYFAFYLNSFGAFYACFLIFMFMDGIHVSFSNVVDIDCGGLDSLATQYEFTIENYIRERFNRIHQIVFDLSFILLTPPVAFVIWQIAFRLDHRSIGTSFSSSVLSLVQPAARSSLGSFPVRQLKSENPLGHDVLSFSHSSRQLTIDSPIVPGPKATGAETSFRDSASTESIDVAILLLGIVGVFAILSFYSLWNYWSGLSRGIKTTEELRDQGNEDFVTPSAPGLTHPNEATSPSSTVVRESNFKLSSFVQKTVERIRDVKEGFAIVLGEKPLGWRLLFLALETALEDAMVSVVIPQVALQMTPLLWKTVWPGVPSIPVSASSFFPPKYVLPPILPGGWAMINFVAVLLIAIGKSGGLVSGAHMSTRWVAPSRIEKSGPYKQLFRYMFFSSASLIAFPVAYWILLESAPFEFFFSGFCSSAQIDIIRCATSMLIVAVAGFFFFLFSTAPKIGFATLLHSLVIQNDVDPKVFGFVGTFVTITDAIVILGLDLVFALCGPDRFLYALLISSGIYLLHGVAQLLIGPPWILAPSSRSPNSDSPSCDYPNFIHSEQSDRMPLVDLPSLNRLDGGSSLPARNEELHHQPMAVSGSKNGLTTSREFASDRNGIIQNQLDALQPMVGSWDTNHSNF